MSSSFLRACPEYEIKSYSSFASHILSFCFISVPSFIEISQVIERARNCMENDQMEITPKIHV